MWREAKKASAFGNTRKRLQGEGTQITQDEISRLIITVEAAQGKGFELVVEQSQNDLNFERRTHAADLILLLSGKSVRRQECWAMATLSWDRMRSTGPSAGSSSEDCWRVACTASSLTSTAQRNICTGGHLVHLTCTQFGLFFERAQGYGADQA